MPHNRCGIFLEFMFLIQTIVIVIACLMPLHSKAGTTVTMSDSIVTVEGSLSKEVADQFISLMDGKNIQRVIFHNSTGGSMAAGQRIAARIINRHITTVVDGYCFSACVTAFLGGDFREFSATLGNHVLALHPPYSGGTGEVLENQKYFYFDWLEKRTRAPLDATFQNTLQQITNPKSAIVIFSENSQLAKKLGTDARYCSGDENGGFEQCRVLENLNARSLRLITQ